LPAEAYGKRAGADFNLARRRDASHNRVLNQNSNNSNLDLNNNQRAPPYGKGRAAPTPETKQPGLTSRKSQDAGIFSFFKGMFGESEEPEKGKSAHRGRVSQ